MSYKDWIPFLVQKIQEIPEINQVNHNENLPGSIQVSPHAIITKQGVNLSYGLGSPAIEYTRIDITVYTTGILLSESHKQLIPIIDLIRNKLAANMKLNDSVDHILPVDEDLWCEGPGQVTFADKNHTAVIFRYIVKENVTGDFTVSM